MTAQIQIFNFEDNQVRTEIVNGEPFFCASDVCKILEIKNGRDVISRLETNDVVLIDTLTNGGIQKISFVNEAGLYDIIFQSRKKEAAVFKRWVMKEVLPQIRKKGYYGAQPQLPEMNAKFLLEIANKMQSLENKIQLDAPKVEKYDLLQSTEGIFNLQQGMSMLHLHPNKAIARLRELSYLHHTPTHKNKAYQIYVDSGYFTNKTHAVNINASNKAIPQTYVTAKGLAYFRDRLDWFKDCANGKEIIAY